MNFSKKRSTGNDTDTGPDFGVLNIGTGAASGILNASVVAANNPNTLSQVNFNHSDNLTFGIPIEGTIKVSQIGTGTTTLTGTNTYSGGTTITAGTLQIGNGGTTGSIMGNVTNNATLVFNRSDSVTFSAAISGTGNLTQNGAGALILSGNNTYAGGTNIAAGILSVGSDGNLGTGNLNVSNNAELLTTGALFTSTKAITLGTGGGTLASVTGGTGQYGGVISGGGPLSIGDAANAGTVILAADNTYRWQSSDRTKQKRAGAFAREQMGRLDQWLRPSVRASWQHEYSYSALPIAARFGSGAGSVFTVHGPAVGHDGALIDAGVNVQWTPTIGTYFGYNGQVGRDKYDSQGGVCSVHWDF